MKEIWVLDFNYCSDAYFLGLAEASWKCALAWKKISRKQEFNGQAGVGCCGGV